MDTPYREVCFSPHDSGKNISYVPNLLNRNDRKKTKQAVKKWMEIVGLEREVRSRYPSELSGGQQQRVGNCQGAGRISRDFADGRALWSSG